MTSKSVDIVELLRREHALTAKLDSAQYGEWAGYVRMLGKLAGDAAHEIERLTGLLKASAAHAENHTWKCGLNPNPYAMKHLVGHCTCLAPESEAKP